MNIDLNKEEKLLLLKTVAMSHMVEFLKRKDNSDLAKLIEKIRDSLQQSNEMDIFDAVFMECEK